jgi:AcrR family transcriptional regulator
MLCLQCIHNSESDFGESMPRRPDPELEEKILDAAQLLWKKGGERALTMRKVARAAGTNTPAVYRRFRDRDDILRGLLQRIRFEIAAEVERASSAEQACEYYLDYALGHPLEYELFYQYVGELDYSGSRRRGRPVIRPAREAMMQKLRGQIGESSDKNEGILLALWMLCHGTAMLLIDQSLLPDEEAIAHEVFTDSVALMLSNAGSIKRSP